jgi:hypothetical protein
MQRPSDWVLVHRTTFPALPALTALRSCPNMAGLFVVFQNMNTDYSFFHLVNAFRLIKNIRGPDAMGEVSSRTEPKLAEINFQRNLLPD